MRILGIMALCLVLIAGLIFVYDWRNEVVDRIADRFEGVLLDEAVVVDATPDQLPLSNPAEGLMIIPMDEAGTLNTLIGFPSFTRATFDMPVASTVRSGEIVLEIAGALQKDAEGRVWIPPVLQGLSWTLMVRLAAVVCKASDCGFLRAAGRHGQFANRVQFVCAGSKHPTPIWFSRSDSNQSTSMSFNALLAFRSAVISASRTYAVIMPGAL